MARGRTRKNTANAATAKAPPRRGRGNNKPQIERHYFESLQPFIARADHLDYDDENKRTVAEEGYFFDFFCLVAWLVVGCWLLVVGCLPYSLRLPPSAFGLPPDPPRSPGESFQAS